MSLPQSPERLTTADLSTFYCFTSLVTSAFKMSRSPTPHSSIFISLYFLSPVRNVSALAFPLPGCGAGSSQSIVPLSAQNSLLCIPSVCVGIIFSQLVCNLDCGESVLFRDVF